MGGESKQSTSAKTALIYLTVGALMSVWTVIYYIFQIRQGTSESVRFWCAGFFFTGLVLFTIGLAIGRIGRAARPAEVAPTPDVVVAPTNAPATAPASYVAENGEILAAPTPTPVVHTAPDVAPTRTPVA